MASLSEGRSIWSYRNLIFTIAWTDLKSRYRSTSLGFLWSLLEPLLIFSVLYVVFTHLFGNRTENYPLYLFLGVIMWHMFAKISGAGLHSIVNKGSIVGKIYLPTEVFVLSSSLASFINVTLEIGVFFIFMVALQFIPPITALLFPLVVLLELVLAVGISFPLSVFFVFYRDLEYVWSVITFSGFYFTPVFYDASSLPASVQPIFLYNPVAGLMTLGRALTLGTTIPPFDQLIFPLVVPFAVLGIGYAIFRHLSSRIAEEL